MSAPEGVHFSFKRYLINGFRKAFDFGGAPVQILFRRKSRR
jgi:GTP-binding protein